ncbi:hypothetical protein PORCRE_206 [Porphyromonas crevioricanis JCM 15906]|uniref:NAD(+)--protein-arginine ADP-ribosyltransferase n=2 Tax=Porphyromonas crevioricanis TaxID=393921 RepID=A0A2X4PKT2_9PORP|nr:hypothetical protein [Porphyromonas crevioricanis]GAD04520.1 hypothetical protein PORCRE_206 [Porphyromonas crevioricanis JCM 15906]GAD07915.1 hypothetical protein PORCAN_1544 [Porphyromonas crevioricanis JCM 13913]SJZ77955.1 hypothetical protein SAMN02745203_00835 [Porphyromonas crevioricanis]SQH72373.1 Uncharacterised protein [Porphyromonas crevioricanis]
MNVAKRFAGFRALGKKGVQLMITIVSKNGRDISQISEFNGSFASENQQEVLFTSNTAFRIDNLEDKGDVVWLNMSEL